MGAGWLLDLRAPGTTIDEPAGTAPRRGPSAAAVATAAHAWRRAWPIVLCLLAAPTALAKAPPPGQ